MNLFAVEAEQLGTSFVKPERARYTRRIRDHRYSESCREGCQKSKPINTSLSIDPDRSERE
jgi:hypothetical protein